MTEVDNLSRQVDEIEALSSIYDQAFKTEDESNRSYSIVVEEGSQFSTILYFQFPEEYPTLVPPVYQLSAPWLKGLEKLELCGLLENLYLDNIGETIIFQWVEKVREFIQHRTSTSDESEAKKTDVELETTEQALNSLNVETHIDIFHGDIIIDRKSTFQGHAAQVKSPTDVHSVLRTLYSNRKIANATHNIYAYRINRENTGNFIQDCEDDGETQAGSRILHLLQILDVSDVLVVVTRWYGGIHLGPDRFRHINNAARQVLQISNLLPSENSTQKTILKNQK